MGNENISGACHYEIVYLFFDVTVLSFSWISVSHADGVKHKCIYKVCVMTPQRGVARTRSRQMFLFG